MVVAPRAGAWIETGQKDSPSRVVVVAPRAGAWIETNIRTLVLTNSSSLPVRERGLKLL